MEIIIKLMKKKQTNKKERCTRTCVHRRRATYKSKKRLFLFTCFYSIGADAVFLRVGFRSAFIFHSFCFFFLQVIHSISFCVLRHLVFRVFFCVYYHYYHHYYCYYCCVMAFFVYSGLPFSRFCYVQPLRGG